MQDYVRQRLHAGWCWSVSLRHYWPAAGCSPSSELAFGRAHERAVHQPQLAVSKQPDAAGAGLLRWIGKANCRPPASPNNTTPAMLVAARVSRWRSAMGEDDGAVFIATTPSRVPDWLGGTRTPDRADVQGGPGGDHRTGTAGCSRAQGRASTGALAATTLRQGHRAHRGRRCATTMRSTSVGAPQRYIGARDRPDRRRVYRGCWRWIGRAGYHRFRAHMTILATGGATACSPRSCTGTAVPWCAAGLPLQDMEFVRFIHPDPG